MCVCVGRGVNSRMSQTMVLTFMIQTCLPRWYDLLKRHMIQTNKSTPLPHNSLSLHLFSSCSCCHQKFFFFLDMQTHTHSHTHIDTHPALGLLLQRKLKIPLIICLSLNICPPLLLPYKLCSLVCVQYASWTVNISTPLLSCYQCCFWSSIRVKKKKKSNDYFMTLLTAH